MQYQEYLQRLRKLLQQYPKQALIIIGVLLSIVLVLVGVFQKNDIDLFATPLDLAQTNEVDARMAEWSIPHRLIDGRITIDASRRNALLLRLALAGLPHPHIATSGETLAKINALTPDAVFQAQSRVGNAGDLAVALRGIDGVDDASVVIAPALMQAFSDQPQMPASAAVRLSIHQGMTLTAPAIDGIRSFVANGVPGLSPDHVAILDDHGMALAGPAAHDDSESVRNALQSAFDQAFGVGSTIVRVHVRSLANGTRTAIAVLIDRRAGIDIAHVRALAAATAGLDLLHGDSLVTEASPFALALSQQLPRRQWNTSSILFSIAIIACVSGTILLCLVLRSSAHFRELSRGTFFGNNKRIEFGRQSKRECEELQRRLQREPAYIIAAVLRHLPAAKAAGILRLFPDDERNEIIARMARPVPIYLGDWEKVMTSSA